MTESPKTKRRSTGGRDFQKGHDPRREGNGRKQVDLEVDAIKAEMRVTIARNLQKYHTAEFDKIGVLMKTPGISMGEALALSFIKQAIVKGCEKRLMILAKIVGLETSTPIVNVDIHADSTKQITMKDVMAALAKDKMIEAPNKENEECQDAILVDTTPKSTESK